MDKMMYLTDDRDLHPAEIGLFVAASLRGYRLTNSKCGQFYRVERGEVVIYTDATFKDVANLCGATGKTTLRQALERDGYEWPSSAKAYISALFKRP